MKKKKTKVTQPRKTTVNHVTSAVGTLFGIPTAHRGSMAELSIALDAKGVLPWLAVDIRLFPYMVDVARSVINCDKDCPLIQELVVYAGDVMWVKDSVRKSKGGMWLAFAEEADDQDSHFVHALKGYYPTMIVSAMQVGDTMYRLCCIHLETLTKEVIYE